jgi:hypothetical protein
VIGLGRRSRQHSIALLPPAPLDPPRRAGHYQDKQHEGRSDEDRDQERAEKAGASLTACEAGKQAEGQVQENADCKEHYAVFLLVFIA